MKTDRIAINNQGIGMTAAFAELEKFAQYQGLDRKETLRLRLLAEEMFGMVQGIVGDFGAYFWLEGEKKKTELHLEAYTTIDIDKREELLSISSSGRNMAAKGVMGKLRDLMENYLLNYEDINRYAADSGVNLFSYDDYGMMYAGMDWTSHYWSLERYKNGVEEHMGETSAVQAWDELEKSIVGKLADDVLVGVRSNKLELIIKKNFA